MNTTSWITSLLKLRTDVWQSADAGGASPLRGTLLANPGEGILSANPGGSILANPGQGGPLAVDTRAGHPSSSNQQK